MSSNTESHCAHKAKSSAMSSPNQHATHANGRLAKSGSTNGTPTQGGPRTTKLLSSDASDTGDNASFIEAPGGDGIPLAQGEVYASTATDNSALTIEGGEMRPGESIATPGMQQYEILLKLIEELQFADCAMWAYLQVNSMFANPAGQKVTRRIETTKLLPTVDQLRDIEKEGFGSMLDAIRQETATRVTDLRTELEELRNTATEHVTLCERHETLQEEHKTLRNEYNTLSNEHDTLRKEYDAHVAKFDRFTSHVVNRLDQPGVAPLKPAAPVGTGSATGKNDTAAGTNPTRASNKGVTAAASTSTAPVTADSVPNDGEKSDKKKRKKKKTGNQRLRDQKDKLNSLLDGRAAAMREEALGKRKEAGKAWPDCHDTANVARDTINPVKPQIVSVETWDMALAKFQVPSAQKDNLLRAIEAHTTKHRFKASSTIGNPFAEATRIFWSYAKPNFYDEAKHLERFGRKSAFQECFFRVFLATFQWEVKNGDSPQEVRNSLHDFVVALDKFVQATCVSEEHGAHTLHSLGLYKGATRESSSR